MVKKTQFQKDIDKALGGGIAIEGESFRSVGVRVGVVTGGGGSGGGRARIPPPSKSAPVKSVPVKSAPTFTSLSGRVFLDKQSRDKADTQFRSDQFREEKRQQDIQSGIKSRSLSGQVTNGGATPPTGSLIDVFEPQGRKPTMEELGAGRGFVRQTFDFAGGFFRAIFNEPTSKERFEGLSKIKLRQQKDIFVQEQPTGTIIFGGKIPPSSASLTPEQLGRGTLKDRADVEFLTAGLGTPVEFIAQDVSRKVSKKAQEDFNKDFAALQADVTSGALEIGEAESKLTKAQEKREKQAQKDFDTAFTPIQEKRGKATATLRSFERTQSLDAQPLVETGALIGLSLTPSGQAGALAIGGGKLFEGLTAPKGERLDPLISAGAFGLVGLGFAGSSIRAEQFARAEALSIKGFKARFPKGSIEEIRFQLPGGGISRVRGAKDLQFFEGQFKQTFETKSASLISDLGSGSTSKGISNIILDVNPLNIAGRGSKRQIIKTSQEINPFGITTDFSTGFKDTQGFGGVTASDVRSQLFGRRITTKDPKEISGFTQKLGVDIFKTTIGDFQGGGILRSVKGRLGGGDLRIQFDPQRALIRIGDPDIVLTRVIRGARFQDTIKFGDFSGTGLNFKLPKSATGSTSKAFQSQVDDVLFKFPKTPKSSTGLGLQGVPSGRPNLQSLFPPQRGRLVAELEQTFVSPDFAVSSIRASRGVQIVQPTATPSSASGLNLISPEVSFQTFKIPPITQTASSFQLPLSQVQQPKLSSSLGLSSSTFSIFDVKTRFATRQLQSQFQPQALKLTTETISSLDFDFTTPTTPPFTPFRTPPTRPGRGFDFGFFPPFPSFPSLGGATPKKKKTKGRAKRKTPIRTSFTGSVLGLVGLPSGTQAFGISPFQLRGLDINPPRKKKPTKIRKTTTIRKRKSASKRLKSGGRKRKNDI